jgi:hypothetical protein
MRLLSTAPTEPSYRLGLRHLLYLPEFLASVAVIAATVICFGYWPKWLRYIS